LSIAPGTVSKEANPLQWNPLPGKIPAGLASEFAAHSLQPDIEQTNLIFYAFAVFAVCNLGIDLVSGVMDSVPLNAFLLVLSLGAASFMRRVLDHRLLQLAVNIVSVLVVAALVLAKTQLAADDWFIYFADVFIIAALTLSVPMNFFAKLTYALLIILFDLYSLQQSGFDTNTAAGITLMLVGITAFSAIIYYKMQQAQFSTFLALRKEKAANEALRAAQSTINELQGLLPICASCKKVRDDNGYWAQIDDYLRTRLDVSVSHGVCPDCRETLESSD